MSDNSTNTEKTVAAMTPVVMTTAMLALQIAQNIQNKSTMTEVTVEMLQSALDDLKNLVDLPVKE